MRSTELLIYYRGYYLPKVNETFAPSDSAIPGTMMVPNGDRGDVGLGWLIFALTCLGLSSIAVIFVHCVGPLSVGSGIAEVKSILSGVMFHRFLGFRTLLGKVVGLILAESSGFSIGKEGPFVHIACCISTLLMRLRIFSRLRKTADKRLEMLSAACAVGVAGSFGATFGGVLFSVEVTTTHYMVRRLPQATFAAVCAALFIRAVGWGEEYELFSTHFNDKKAHSFFFICFSFSLESPVAFLVLFSTRSFSFSYVCASDSLPITTFATVNSADGRCSETSYSSCGVSLLYISRRWRGRSSPCCVLVTLNLFEVCLQVLIKKTMISLIRSSCGHTCQPSSSTRRFLS